MEVVFPDDQILIQDFHQQFAVNDMASSESEQRISSNTGSHAVPGTEDESTKHNGSCK